MGSTRRGGKSFMEGGRAPPPLDYCEPHGRFPKCPEQGKQRRRLPSAAAAPPPFVFVAFGLFLHEPRNNSGGPSPPNLFATWPSSPPKQLLRSAPFSFFLKHDARRQALWPALPETSATAARIQEQSILVKPSCYQLPPEQSCATDANNTTNTHTQSRPLI